MTDIFLSYSRDDQATARRFAEAFERDGLTVWWDQTLKAGEAYDRVTERALQDAKAVVVLWSKKSVESHWVRSEATQAQANGTLVPVMIEPCKRPIMFELMHTAELAHWKGDPHDSAWQTFLGDVRQFVKKEGTANSHAAISPAPRKRKLSVGALVGIVAAVLVASGVGLWAFKHKPDSHPKGVTLAVLPFANLSSDPEQEYFSDGLTEEILNQLAQIKDLAVTGRTSSFSFKGKNEDLRTIAEKLGVANLLEGSIRKDGSQLRITAQLINGASGTRMWSQTYARESKEIFAVQEEIAKDVAQALSIKLDVGDTSRAMGGTTNLEAYYKYLQARTLGYQGGIAQFDQASQLYREAVALDPTFSRAWVGLMGALRGTLVWAPENTAAATKEMDDIRAHLETIAPDAWWTQAERSSFLLRQHKWYEAEASINAALATAPASGLDVVKAAEAAYLAGSGRIKDLVSHLERWRKMDPLSLTVSGELQAALSSAGRAEDAQVEYERSKTLVGDHGQWEHHALLRLLSSKDADLALIKVQFRQFVDHAPVPMALDHELIDKLDDKAAARAAIRRAFEDPANNDGTRMAIVMYYADRFGDRDLALAALRKELFELQYSLINQFTIWYPFMSGVRAAPGFKEIVRDLGLVDYWRASGNWGDFCKPVGADDFECH